MSYRKDWNRGVLNRNYHVLQGIVDSGYFDTILSVDFLPFSFKKKMKVLLSQRPFMKQSTTVFKTLGTRVDADPDKTQLFHMTATSLRHLRKALAAIDFPEDVTVWSYTPFIAEHLDVLPPYSQFVFDAVDNWVEHPAYGTHVERLKKDYAILQDSADVIFTVSEVLVDFLGKKEHVFFVPNGVDAVHFGSGVCKQPYGRDVSREQNIEQQKIIGYHGVIQSRVNIAIIEHLAENFPEYYFVIVGPVWKEMREVTSRLDKKNNVEFLGAVSYHELPNIISCFDAAIIPHKVDTFTQSMNPLKLYEYLAAGKPIVATPIAGAEQFQDLIQIAVSADDFAKELRLALQNDSDELRKRRKQMAETYAWENRIHVMLDILDKARHDTGHDNSRS